MNNQGGGSGLMPCDAGREVRQEGRGAERKTSRRDEEGDRGSDERKRQGCWSLNKTDATQHITLKSA